MSKVVRPMKPKLQEKHQTKKAHSTNELSVTFWGVRGTLPSPGPCFNEFGGHTSCVEVALNHQRSSVILDAGTGIVACAEAGLRRGQKSFHILLSHFHYDHVIGLTRFKPLFCSDIKIHFYGQSKGGLELHEIIEKLFCFPFFPVEYRSLPSRNNLHFHPVQPGSPFEIDDLVVTAQELCHPQQALAYRVWNKDLTTSVVYATDHEQGTEADVALATFARDADLLLFDTTYTDEVYQKSRRGWGHSTARRGGEIATMANVRQFGLFHHDPDSTDEILKTSLLPEALAYFPATFLCQEGAHLTLGEHMPENQLLLAAGGGSPIRRTLLSKRRKISG